MVNKTLKVKLWQKEMDFFNKKSPIQRWKSKLIYTMKSEVLDNKQSNFDESYGINLNQTATPKHNKNLNLTLSLWTNLGGICFNETETWQYI